MTQNDDLGGAEFHISHLQCWASEGGAYPMTFTSAPHIATTVLMGP